MKKILFIALCMTLTLSVRAQVDLQFQYDFGSDRRFVTTTIEMFKDDKWGHTYFFVDHDFGEKDSNHQAYAPSGTYMEIGRALNFWKNTKMAPLSAYVEYDGGVYRGYSINNSWLFGGNYFMHSADYKYTLTLMGLFKTIAKTDQNLPLQFTTVWGVKDLFGVKGLEFSGFADYWWETHNDANGKTHHSVFISEPQLWYKVGQHFGVENLNVGGEVEFSNNFGTYDGFKCNPCLGVKWVF